MLHARKVATEIERQKRIEGYKQKKPDNYK